MQLAWKIWVCGHDNNRERRQRDLCVKGVCCQEFRIDQVGGAARLSWKVRQGRPGEKEEGERGLGLRDEHGQRGAGNSQTVLKEKEFAYQF